MRFALAALNLLLGGCGVTHKIDLREPFEVAIVSCPRDAFKNCVEPDEAERKRLHNKYGIRFWNPTYKIVRFEDIALNRRRLLNFCGVGATTGGDFIRVFPKNEKLEFLDMVYTFDIDGNIELSKTTMQSGTHGLGGPCTSGERATFADFLKAIAMAPHSADVLTSETGR